MEITIKHEQLLRALEIANRISAKNLTLPVLQCVKLEAKENHLKIEATNLEVNLSISIESRVSEAGVTAVPTQVFLQSIQQIEQPEITLRIEDNTLQLETATTNTSIKTFDSEEFPNIHQLEGDSLPVSGSTFAYAIKSCAFAASNTSIKPELGSVFIEQKKEHTLTFVSTDSFRLMEKTVSQKGLILENSFMIPAKNALELARVIEIVGGEDPQLFIDENQCALKFPSGTYISSRLVNGSFPDYNQIIPKEFVTHATVLKDDLSKSLKKTTIFLNKFRQTSFTITDSSLTIASQNNDVGHTTDTIKAEIEGEDLSLSFNQQYLTEPLQFIQDDSIKMSFAGVGRAMILEGVGDRNARYLVMPMNK